MHFTNLLRFNDNRRISAANKSKETKTRQSLDIQFSFPDLQINPWLNLKTAEHNEEGIQSQSAAQSVTNKVMARRQQNK